MICEEQGLSTIAGCDYTFKGFFHYLPTKRGFLPNIKRTKGLSAKATRMEDSLKKEHTSGVKSGKKGICDITAENKEAVA